MVYTDEDLDIFYSIIERIDGVKRVSRGYSYSESKECIVVEVERGTFIPYVDALIKTKLTDKGYSFKYYFEYSEPKKISKEENYQLDSQLEDFL